MHNLSHPPPPPALHKVLRPCVCRCSQGTPAPRACGEQFREAGGSQSWEGLGCWVQFGWGHVGCGEPLQVSKPGSGLLPLVIHRDGSRGPVEEGEAVGTALLWGLRPPGLWLWASRSVSECKSRINSDPLQCCCQAGDLAGPKGACPWRQKTCIRAERATPAVQWLWEW